MASAAVRAAAREHVERIRRERFYIGREEKNPLADDIHQAVTYLSQELNSKDVHFLMELIQNAEDNDYPVDVAPALDFVIIRKDITATGANSTLLVFNNERGFSAANIESICRIGKSTKKGNRHLGYIGEKGIGFKSVFLVSSQPHIFSNGYQIKFNEEPSADCEIGYIVPEWVDEKPSIGDIQAVYGYSKSLPMTTIILPLKNDKILAVKKELSNTHPEILLFLSKIRQLSVREINDDSKASKLSQISISSEVDYKTRKDINAESYNLHLAMQENGDGQEEECTYYMWKQKFAVKPECRVKKRVEVDQWVINLAFPHGQRLSRGARSPGVYAYLPTEMVTNFPFIIQADFLLASSRESILFDSQWNLGILECVPSVFVNAFAALLKSSNDAPLFALAPIFRFLPIHASSLSVFDPVRLSIKNKVAAEDIMPCESCPTQKVFCKPSEVRRLDSSFWRVLNLAQKQGIDLQCLSARGTCILSAYLDSKKYDDVLRFLGVQYVSYEWYGEFIDGSNLVKQSSEEVYLETLSFVAEHWRTKFSNTNMMRIPLIKYVGRDGRLSYCSLQGANRNFMRICMASNVNELSWLISWSKELSTTSGLFFVPLNTQRSLDAFIRRTKVMKWLQNIVKIEILTLYEYASAAAEALTEAKLALVYSHFLYHSHEKKYITEGSISNLCHKMPVVDNFGHMIAKRNILLVPAEGSKWFTLIGTNPWRSQNYIELSTDYKSSGTYARNYTPGGQLITFLRKYAQAVDVPYMHPPNASFPSVSYPLPMGNALLLLQWIRNIRSSNGQLPQNFFSCIRNGRWLKTSLGYKSPSVSFLSGAGWGSKLHVQFVFADVPIIDEEFYGNKMSTYKEELRAIGVQFEFVNAHVHIGNQPLTKENAILLLQWIRSLRSRGVQLPQNFLSSIRNGKWLKTSIGYNSPSRSFLSNTQSESLQQIISRLADVPIIDQEFYENKLSAYKEELRAIGVQFDSADTSIHIVNHLMSISSSDTLSRANVFGLLQLIRFLNENNLTPPHLIERMKNGCWLKTCHGNRSPVNSVLFNSEWKNASLISNLSFIDTHFYGEDIADYKTELELLGVLVGFKQNYQLLVDNFKLCTDSITPDVSILILKCIRYAKVSQDFVKELKELRWVKTDLGFRAPPGTFLIDNDSKCLLKIVDELPLLDLHFYGGEIRTYEGELRKVGLIVGFKEVSKAIVWRVKKLLRASYSTKEMVFSMLECYRELRKNHEKLPVDLVNCMRHERWLHTSLGFRSPEEAILFSSEWSHISLVSSLPFIDDNNDSQYGLGNDIYSYRDELMALGSKIELEQGAAFVLSGLRIPNDASAVTPEAVVSLLKCIRSWMKYGFSLPDNFMSAVNVKWVKTTAGYRHPNECLLFGSLCSSLVQRDDGPFIDEVFYGQEVLSYESELQKLGVVNARSGCALMAQHLKLLSDTDTISRIYSYLEAFHWKPRTRNVNDNWIWIPDGSDKGQWVNPGSCVLYDRNNIFGSELHVLVKWYDHKLLRYFNTVFGVKRHPTLGDYCKLWGVWQVKNSPLSFQDCSSFWEFISKQWSTEMGKYLAMFITKFPVRSGDHILLIDKQDVFIPDDLLLEDLFNRQAEQPLFVWYPSASSSLLSPAKLNDIYSSIGVQKISMAVSREESNGLQLDAVTVVHNGTVIKPGLLRIVLAFLADPILDIAAEKRHGMVACLTNILVYETNTPLTVSYQVGLSSSRSMVVKSARLFRWERENSRLIVRKHNGSGLMDNTAKIEYASYFAEEISKGLLFERKHLIPALVDLLRTGFLLDFEIQAVKVLLKLKNLRLFEEDQEFLLPYAI